MTCAICGSATRRGRPALDSPPSLVGQEACDWCGQRLSQLHRGELAEADLAQLLRYAAKLADPAVAAELQTLWPDHAARAGLREQAAAEEAAFHQALTAMPVTSGFAFEGSRIVNYLGFTSAEVVLGMGLFRGMGADFADFFGTESQGLAKKLADAKSAAFGRLRRDVLAMGGNAIIGIDLDYTMFGTTLVGVIASGTAVVIEAEGGGR